MDNIQVKTDFKKKYSEKMQQMFCHDVALTFF